MPRRRDEDDEDRPPTRRSRQLPGSAPPAQPVTAIPAAPRGQPLPFVGSINKQFPDKGYGFIREDETGREYFFHYEGTREGTRQAFVDLYTEGTAVRFDGRNGPKGWRASAVELVPAR